MIKFIKNIIILILIFQSVQIAFGKKHNHQKITTSFSSLNISPANSLWDSSAENLARELQLTCDSKNDKNSWYSGNNPQKRLKLLNCNVTYVLMHGTNNKPDYFSFFFSNKGDNVDADTKQIFEYMRQKGTLKKTIKAESKTIKKNFERLFGKPVKLVFGEGKVKENVNAWIYGNTTLLFSSPNNEYVNLKIISKKILSRKNNRINIKNNITAKTIKDNIKKSGKAVYINNIPMVNQGTKGYCTPAIWTRYLRYLGFYTDMYTLAKKGTAAGGGSSSLEMKYTVNTILNSYNMKIRSIGTSIPKIKKIEKYIDQGLPLVWHMFVGGSQSNAHTRLIIGYNKSDNTIAYSDSWGSGHELKWTSEHKAIRETSRTPLEVISF